MKSASEVLKGLLQRRDTKDEDCLTVREIVDGLHERGFGVLMLLFALPLSIPMPVPPGYTTILGFPLLIFSAQMVLGHKAPWIPKWLGNKSIRRTTLATFIERSSSLLIAIEKVMRPRLFSANQDALLERICGIICLLCALSIAIPLPLTNFIPAGGIALISLGLMSRDGLFIILGIIISVLGLGLTAAVILFGVVAVKKAWFFVLKLLGL
jgi:hypothetical protein